MLAAVAGCIILTWVVCAVILICIGFLILGAFARIFDLEDAFCVGLITVSVFLQIWNLFLPVTTGADLVLLGIGGLGFYRARRRLIEWGRDLKFRRGLLVLYGFLIAGIAFRAAGPCEYYDTGLYGAQFVRWIETYPAVFGLANLHGRLGFNSSVFLIDAALAQGPWRNFYFHLLGGFFLGAFWALILPACARVVKRAEATSSDWFRVILVIALAAWSARGVVVGTTTDEPSTILCLAAAAVLFETLEKQRVAVDDSGLLLKVAVTATLFPLAVTFKLSVVAFSFLAWLYAFAVLYAARPRSRLVWVATGGAIVVLLPWIAARIVLSGYPFFPNSALPFSGDWRVPRAIADMYELWVQSWGRIRLPTAEGFAWLGPWSRDAIRDRTGFQVPLLISFASGVIVLGRKAIDGPTRSRGLCLLLPSIGGILFWFWKSPDPRFGQAAIWTFAAILGALAIDAAIRNSEVARVRVVVAGLGFVTMWCLLSFGWQHSYRVLESVHGFVPLPTANLSRRETLSRLAVFAPADGNQCWDTELLCTPYFDKTLRLRWPSSMRWGFESEGQPELPHGSR